jgi:hypothetical protein
MPRELTSTLIVAALVLLVFQFVLEPGPAQALGYGNDSSLNGAKASFFGEANNDMFSRMVANAGDVNGDGFKDILMTAPYNNDGGAHAGKVYLFFGRATGWSKDINVSNANASFVAEGAGDAGGSAGEGTGLCGGDINGDGLSDIVIGMPQNDDAGSNRGQVYIIFGKKSGWQKNVDLTQADASFRGEYNGDWLGRYADCDGDVNGDRIDDLVMGASVNDENGVDSGQVYIVFGQKGGWAMDTNVSTADASLLGESGGDSAGISLAIAPDVNGDGIDDIVIGAANNDRGGNLAGSAYLALGRKTSDWKMDMPLASKANASWYGEGIQDAFGYLLDGLGDVNGDGLGDIVAGSYLNNGNGADAGQAYIIFGRRSGWGTNVNISAGMNASYFGEALANYAGRGVAGPGDVDGDGLNDILISSPDNGEVAALSGEAYLVLGKTAGWAKRVNLNQADASWRGEMASSIGGRTVAGGDFNADGLADVLISAHLDSEHGTSTGQGYVISPDSNKVPTGITVVKAFDKGYVTELKTAAVNDTIYIQLNGTDADAAKANLAIARVTSNVSDTIGVNLVLKETGPNTGIFRGNFTVRDRTSEGLRWINATMGETVKVSSFTDPSKNATVFIGKIDLRPKQDETTATEDTHYTVKYSTVNGTATKWKLTTNASWLGFNATTHRLEGTPDNGDVGVYSVTLNASNDWGSSDEHHFHLTVKNVPPTIQTVDLATATEDRPYWNDYASDDDGQGTVTWHLASNASWLKVAPATGNLTGTPGNAEVGKYWVNVSVDDGNGGWGSSNFTLTVKDVNDPPVITTKDVLTAYEDTEYSVMYNATDIDLVPDVLVWSLSTNATWLALDAPTRILNGTPTNDEVGKYLVNVTVSDGRGGRDSHLFNLTVINVNDRPSFTSVPNFTARVGSLYSYQARAVDIDKGDVLEYSLRTAPAGMTVNKTTGLVTWTPILSQNGTNHIILKVSDGLVYVEQDFNITVPVPSKNHPPVATLQSPQDGTLLEITNPGLSWSGKDDDNDALEYDVYLGLDQSKVAVRDVSMRRASGITVTTYQAPALQKGSTYYWTVVPNDKEGPGECPSGVWAFTISDTAVVNNPPVITSTPVTKGTVGKQYRYDVHATDKDAGDTLTYLLEKAPPTMSIDRLTGVITWVPAPVNVGTVLVIVSVTDGKAFAEQSFTIAVTKENVVENKLPVLDVIPQQSATVGKAFSFIVKAHDPDTWDAKNLTFSLNKSPAGMTIDGKTGEIRWTPTKAHLGDNTIVVAVTDTKASVNNSFIIVVKDVTNPPNNGNDPWANAMLWVLALIIIIVCIILILMFVAMRRRKAAAKEEAALRKASRSRMAADGHAVSKRHHAEEPILSAIPVDEAPSPKAVPGPKEEEEDTTITRSVHIGKRSYSKKEIKEVLKALPHELPVVLLMKSREDAAEEVLKAEYKKNRDGHVIVNLGGDWFYGDPKYLSKYLMAYVEEPEVEAGAPETKDEVLGATTAEAEQRSVADEVIAKLDAKEKEGPPKEVKVVKKKKVKSAVSESELEDTHDTKSEKPHEEKKADEFTDIDSMLKDLDMK